MLAVIIIGGIDKNYFLKRLKFDGTQLIYAILNLTLAVLKTTTKLPSFPIIQYSQICEAHLSIPGQQCS